MRLTSEKTQRFEIPNDEDGGYINIRLLSLHDISRIEAKCNETGIDDSGNVRVNLDPFKRANLVAQDCMVGWGNMYDTKGKELKFSRKNFASAQHIVIDLGGEEKPMRFSEWVDKCHSEFYDSIHATEVKKAKENS